MLKIVKAGGAAVGTGVVIGLGIVGWMRVHPAEKALANTSGGSVALDTRPTPQPDPEESLLVMSPAMVSAGGGGAGGLLGSGGNGSAMGTGTGSTGPGAPAEPKRLPGPDEFAQYEQYANSPTAMFGDVRVGNGAAVELGSTVAVKYRGWLTNGTLIDDSQDKAFSFVEGEHRVIAGWEQGLLGMRAGGKRRLIVPPGQGYGSEAHDVVPANSTLIFDVELVEVK